MIDAEILSGAPFLVSAVITLSDGTVISPGLNGFMSGGSIQDGVGESGLPLGVAVSRTIQIELDNHDGRYEGVSFDGARIALSLVQREESPIYMGAFTVVTPATYGGTVIITAQDDMHKADQPFGDTTLTYPVKLSDLYAVCCSACGLIPASVDIPNGDYMVQTAPSPSLTYRAVIGYIAMLCGGNARVSRAGQMEIIPYDFKTLEQARAADDAIIVQDAGRDGNLVFVSDDEVAVVDGEGNATILKGAAKDDGEGNIVWKPYDVGSAPDVGIHDLTSWINLTTSTDDTVITGVRAILTGEDGSTFEILEGDDGYVLSVFNPLIEGNAAQALKYMGDALIGGRIRKFSGEHTSYPLAEFMDLCRITDKKGRVSYSVITDVNFVSCGITGLSNNAESALSNAAKYVTPETLSMIAVQRETRYLRSYVDKAVDAIRLGVEQGYITKENAEELYTELKSLIEITADGITATVSATYETKGDAESRLSSAQDYTDKQVASAKSEVKQTTDAITMSVSQKVGGDEIISRINQSAESVTIEARRIDLKGAVTAEAIAAGSVTTEALAAGAVKAENIDAGAVTTDKLRLYGSLDVFTDKSLADKGGDLGYTSEGYKTEFGSGIMLSSRNKSGYAAATDNGVFLGYHSATGGAWLDGSGTEISEDDYECRVVIGNGEPEGPIGGAISLYGDVIAHDSIRTPNLYVNGMDTRELLAILTANIIRPGDTITLNCCAYGFLSGGRETLCIGVPLRKLLSPSVTGFTVSNPDAGSVIVRQDGKYLLGSASAGAAWSTFSALSYGINEAGLRIVTTQNELTEGVNNAPCSFYIRNTIICFT